MDRILGHLEGAGILLPVLDQPRRAECVGVVEHGAVQRLHVVLVEHHRHRHHHREVLERAAVVVLHRHHGARAGAHQHHVVPWWAKIRRGGFGSAA
ncbi:MAG TPA: hypothetical protein VHT91_43990 [Kofleriaceae bacterium]|nr:hypothetical protein [Kofleriaceae bacterium]